MMHERRPVPSVFARDQAPLHDSVPWVMTMRMGVDIGGTFTDLLLVNDRSGQIIIEKVLTTYPDPSDGVMTAVEQAIAHAGASLGDVEVLVHGTTLAINTLIERTGSQTALFATQGHRDAIEIRREQRYDMYDVLLEAPEPLAPRHLRFDVEERVSADGEIVRPLNRDQVAQLLRRLEQRGIEALAICLLHSYRNPAHELAIAEIAKDAAPRLRLSLSSRVAPEIKEYERASTTLCNAYVQARVDSYLGRLERELGNAGFRGAFFLMQSSGGLIKTATARELPFGFSSRGRRAERSPRATSVASPARTGCCRSTWAAPRPSSRSSTTASRSSLPDSRWRASTGSPAGAGSPCGFR